MTIYCMRLRLDLAITETSTIWKGAISRLTSLLPRDYLTETLNHMERDLGASLILQSLNCGAISTPLKQLTWLQPLIAVTTRQALSLAKVTKKSLRGWDLNTFSHIGTIGSLFKKSLTRIGSCRRRRHFGFPSILKVEPSMWITFCAQRWISMTTNST